MPIPVLNNAQYGGVLVNQKYAPLAVNAAPIDNTAQAEYVSLFTNRINLLNGQGLMPRQLNLYTANWAAVRAAEALPASLPPIVVISSNRSQWIFTGYDTAANLQPLNANFTDVNDIRALVAGGTPLYLPKRINDANRHVYILVHRTEYAQYQQVFAGTPITIIGWEFDVNRVVAPGGIVPRDTTYVGFGATRFAAIEFCKHVLCVPAIPAARQKAWLVDDNVVYVRGLPPFATVETAMTDAVWGLGFQGATQNSTFNEITAIQPGNPANMNALQTAGLLQQFVLWNIGQLNAQFLNYSPYFIASNEDLSFSNFLQNQAQSRLRYSSGATVFKGNVTADSSAGAKRLGLLRDTAVSNYYDIENAIAVAASQDQGGNQELNEYVTTYVLPNALQDVRKQWPIYAESIAVEQLMSKVIADKYAWVPAGVFRPNGNAAQALQTL